MKKTFVGVSETDHITSLKKKIANLKSQENAILAGQEDSDIDIIQEELKHNSLLLKKLKGTNDV